MSKSPYSVTSLKIFVDGKETYSVEANTKIKIVINGGEGDVSNATLYLAEMAIETFDVIPKGAQILNEYELDDLVGKNRLSLKGEDGAEICPSKNLIVSPQYLLMNDFQEIKHNRIPALLSQINAENIIDMIYRGGSKTMTAKIEEYSVDRLLYYYSEKLFYLTAKIAARMNYRSRNVRRNYKGMVKGKINWVKTIAFRSNKGADADVVFVCDQRKRTYNTTLNLILTRFHYEVFKEARFLKGELERREHEKGIWKKIYGYQEDMYDKKTLDFLNSLKEILAQHREFLVTPVIKDLIGEAIRFGKGDESVIRRGEMEARKSKNKHYMPLLELWKEFVRSYSSIFETTVFVDTQRMRDVYKLWCVCELANAMEMRSIGRTLREFKAVNKNAVLYFGKLLTLKHGWISENFSYDSMTGPEILLVNEGQEFFIEANYGAGEEVNKEDIYRILGYLNDYNIKIGVVLYPGSEFKIIWEKMSRHIVVRMPFRPVMDGGVFQHEANAAYLRFVLEAVARLKKALAMNYDLTESIETIRNKVKTDFLGYYDTGVQH